MTALGDTSSMRGEDVLADTLLTVTDGSQISCPFRLLVKHSNWLKTVGTEKEPQPSSSMKKENVMDSEGEVEIEEPKTPPMPPKRKRAPPKTPRKKTKVDDGAMSMSTTLALGVTQPVDVQPFEDDDSSDGELIEEDFSYFRWLDCFNRLTCGNYK